MMSETAMFEATKITVEMALDGEENVLTQVQTVTFDDDTFRYLGKERGGPAGYDSLAYTQELMASRRFYAIKRDGAIIGGVVKSGPMHGVLRINRLFLHPQEQGRGYGTIAMRAMEDIFPEATRLVLDTPVWAKRNQHFYEGLGYRRMGEAFEPEEGFMLVLYEKRRGGPS
jgi:GNAT superfamily N-acetyltransferase